LPPWSSKHLTQVVIVGFQFVSHLFFFFFLPLP
jgi:hypothetical protein